MRTGIAWDITPTADAYDLYLETPGVVAFDATTIVASDDDAESVERVLQARMAKPTRRRVVEFARASDDTGWWIKDILEGELS